MSIANQAAQQSRTSSLQSAASADGNGTVVNTDGFNGAQMVEIQKTGTGNTTVTFQGSFDGSTWYSVGFYQVDAQSTLSRSAAAFAIGTGAQKHVYQLLDLYPQIRCLLSSTSGTVSLTANLYAVAC